MQDNVDAFFHIEVKKYGLSQAGPFTRKLKPLVEITLQLVDETGKILWGDSEYISHWNEEAPQHMMSEYLSDQDVFRASMEAAFCLAVSAIMEGLN